MAAVPREREPVTGAHEHHPQSFAARAEAYPRVYPRANTEPGSMESSLSPPGIKYRDGMTIRAVTPEPDEFRLRGEGGAMDGDVEGMEEHDRQTGEPALVIGDGGVVGHVTATPPRTPSRSTVRSTSRWDLLGRASPEPLAPSSPDKPRSLVNRKSMPMTVATQFSDFGISRAKSRSPSDKMRHRAGNGIAVVASPEEIRPGLAELSVGTKAYGTSRQRYGASTVPGDNGQMPLSVGYPSTHTLPVMPSHGTVKSQSSSKVSRSQRLLRAQSSISTLTPSKSTDNQQPSSPINTEYSVLLQLMKTLRGRMEGYVDFRIGASMMWTKGYCFIDSNSGSLMYQKDEQISGPVTVIIPDLRGCQVKTETDEDGIIDISTHSFKIVMKLRPLNVQQYEHWLAALLCWRPIRPAGAQNKMVKTQAPLCVGKQKRRRNSDTVTKRQEVAIIKVGSMRLWRPEKPEESLGNGSSNQKTSSKQKASPWPSWQKVSCLKYMDLLARDRCFRSRRRIRRLVLRILIAYNVAYSYALSKRKSMSLTRESQSIATRRCYWMVKSVRRPWCGQKRTIRFGERITSFQTYRLG
jgi:hypothetical protein